MSFFTEMQGNVEHEYFQAGRGRKIYLGRKDKPESARPENIIKALEYVGKKNTHYFEIAEKLLLRLPQKERDKVLRGMIEDLYRIAEEYGTHISRPPTKKSHRKN